MPTEPKKHKIQVLSTQTTSQIAAGEVIERPAHLLKELVENSIDAKATKIEINFDHSGRTLHIRDNGIGIQKNDLILALQRHATSKIKSFDDLSKLQSFGFRGEALASAMAVSKLTLTSCKKEDQKTYQLVSQFGKLGPVKEVAGEPGTLILIENLFSNVPVRLKFLKSEIAEFQQIKKTLKALALAHPEIHFHIKSKNKLLYTWPSSNLFSRVKMILEKEDLFYTESDFKDLNVKAILGSPNQTLTHQKGLWFFVCNRWVQDRTIQAALMQAYDRLLMKKEFPMSCIFVQCNPSSFDVNIHPNKSQVKFQDSSLIFKAVYKCVKEGLSQTFWLKNILSENKNFKHQKEKDFTPFQSQPLFSHTPNPNPSPNLNEFHFFQNSKKPSPKKELSSLKFSSSKLSEPSKSSESSLSVSQTRAPIDIKQSLQEDFFFKPNLEQSKEESTINAVQNKNQKPFWSSLFIIGQAKLTYIIAQTEKSIIFLDQHAAHERINYERYQKIWKSGKGFKRQNFLLPYDIELKETDLKLLAPKLSELFSLGVQAEIAGPSSIVVRSAFALIKPKSFKPLFELLIREIEKYGESFALEKIVGDIFASLACHSSIRAGQALNQKEMQALLDDMDEFPFSSFCPHGRPVFVEYSFTQLEKDFKRTL